MLSNRESARRSRKRKQEQLQELETQIKQLQQKNDSLEQQCQAAADHVAVINGDKQRLENENHHLNGILTALQVSPRPTTLHHDKRSHTHVTTPRNTVCICVCRSKHSMSLAGTRARVEGGRALAYPGRRIPLATRNPRPATPSSVTHKTPHTHACDCRAQAACPAFTRLEAPRDLRQASRHAYATPRAARSRISGRASCEGPRARRSAPSRSPAHASDIRQGLACNDLSV